MVSVRGARLTTLALALLGTFGCRDVVSRVYQPPTAELRSVGLRQIGVDGATLDVVLELRNPNPYALTATRADYRLFIHDTVDVGHGTMLDTITVGGHDSATVQLPLEVGWRAVREAGREALQGGTVDYRIAGEVVARTPIGSHAFPLETRGRVAGPALGQ